MALRRGEPRSRSSWPTTMRWSAPGCATCSTPQDGLEVVAEAGTSPRRSRPTRPSPVVLVLDLGMPGDGPSSLDALPSSLGRRRRRKVVVLTMQDDPEFARRALRSGAQRLRAQGGGARPSWSTAVRRAADGESYLNPALGARWPPTTPGPDPGAARRPDRARGRDTAVDRARPHQRGDRQAALPLGAHGRGAPRARPAEDRPLRPAGARPLRAGARAARRRGRPATTAPGSRRANHARTIVRRARSTVSVPPASRRARASRPAPKPGGSGRARASKPSPSSTTLSATGHRPRVTSTLDAWACACLATFVSASCATR